MKLNNIELNANDFANEMAKLRNEKHFDFLVTIVGEDFGEEGFGCIYILENTQTYERISVKVVAVDRENPYLPSVTNLWKAGTRGLRLLRHQVHRTSRHAKALSA